ncbi:fibronectin-binding protein (FBP) [Heliobacterium undosum]|uniref:Fibronectin-binding protein (FBP) n=1 Tax=Heliomicrobium undosum TaxID=121734 RepID=A0A845KX85_9FIRM|nr:SIR2 family protein [Heliomicrobium undosum]MZP28107.1 fibronectin-binding protein (FBP) [Heliomicrobium undosum]
MEKKLNWDAGNVMKVNREVCSFESGESIEGNDYRRHIEPWLSAIFQSEHLSLLVGAGLTTAVTAMANCAATGMGRLQFECKYKENISNWADQAAGLMGRGEANFEDDLRTAIELLKGLKIAGSDDAPELEERINSILKNFITSILGTERTFIEKNDDLALSYLKSFLISFSSRTASRDRLNIFTTNYDRFIEYGCDMAGIITIDRFIGRIKPIFRTTKLELDYHYNPPGIRGEPRYVEGVARITKLHGSIDWRFENGQIIKVPIGFGQTADDTFNGPEQLVIYPNSAKDIETAFYPYAELFRDLSYAVCRPNSVLVTYGYSFGDSHINRIIQDMLTIPSTHIVIIAFDDRTKRIKQFYQKNNPAQITLLIGNHFGNLKTLVEYYLPKAAIDRISIKSQQLKEKRGDIPPRTKSDEEEAGVSEA